MEGYTEKVAGEFVDEETTRMTFWLPKDMIREIKARAKREKRTASDILREILGEFLKNK